jgi:hypothetical protein
MKYRIYFLLLLTIICQSVSAQQQDSLYIRKIFNEVMTNANAYENLRFICKKIGPRLSGSANAAKAVIETARMMKEAGADTVYLQPCMVPHWVRGEKESGYVTLMNGEKRQLKLCALGNSLGSSKKGVKAQIIEVKSIQQIKELGEKNIKGKIVFLNIPMNPTYLYTFHAYGESGVARWSGPSEASKYGAIGTMVRSLASNADDYPHTGVMSYNDSFPKIPAVAISTNDAEWLSDQLKNNNINKGWFKTSCEMLADVPSANVIGEIRGSEMPDDIITVGGHLDSWDLAEGAHDDGAGCAQSIELLRTFRAIGYKPKRTLRIVMFMNEENGSRGEEAYFKAAKENKEKHVFAVESDAGGFSPSGFGTDMTPSQFAKVISWKHFFEDYDINKFSNDGSGSDIGSLKELGTALAELRPDSQRYFDVHHAKTDVFEAISKRELNLGAFALAAFAYLVDQYGF